MATKQPSVRWWQQSLQQFASSRVGATLFSHVLHPIDSVLLRLSGGRIALPRVLAGLPVVELTATGAKTGLQRTVPVLGFQDGDRWFLVASNWGRKSHPAWYYNVKANPEVTLRTGGRTGQYVAREATADERETYWNQAGAVYRGFDAYQQRAGDRTIPVVVLTPTDA